MYKSKLHELSEERLIDLKNAIQMALALDGEQPCFTKGEYTILTKMESELFNEFDKREIEP